MTTIEENGSILVDPFVKMLNNHEADAVVGFVANDYVNHNPFVGDGQEANRTFWATFLRLRPPPRSEDGGSRGFRRPCRRAIHVPGYSLGSLLWDFPNWQADRDALHRHLAH